MKKYDKEYATQYNPEMIYLLNKNIKPSYVKNINGMNSLIVEFVIKKMKMQMIEMKNYCTFQINPSQIVNSRKCIMS